MAVESINPLSAEESAVSAQEAVEVTQPAQTEHGHAEAEDTPRGALAFGLIVLAGFAIYWLLTYIEIVIARQ
jgi:sarcosine oxidase gamma subunit